MNALMPMLLILVVVMIIISVCLPLFDFLAPILARRKKKSWVENANDAHIALFRKRRKIAKENIRDLDVKRVLFLGDEDYYDNDYGRVKGLIWKNEIVEGFFQFRRFRPWKWSHLPKELVRDPLAKVLRIKCNGLEPIGNFYKPIYTKDVMSGFKEFTTINPGTVELPLRKYYDALILDHEKYLMTLEKSIELEEQKANAQIDAVDVQREAGQMVERKDYAPMVPGTPEEGKQYEQS